MLNALTGFAVVGLAIIVGFIVGRTGLVGEHGRYVLSRLTFFVLSPFLLFSVLSQADVHMLFSSQLPVAAISAVTVFVLYGLVAGLVLRRTAGAAVIGSLGAGYVNANNIGLPIATYVLGNGAYSAPVILMQLLLFTPVFLVLLDGISTGGMKLGPILGRTARNPMIIGALLGTIVAATGIDLPPIVVEPTQLLADAAIPVLLISFGLSLSGSRVLSTRGTRADVLVASAMKLFLMPAVAWLVGSLVFGMTGAALLAVVVMASLPSAQNVFNYAQRYGVGEVVARDIVFITTVGSVPVLLVVVWLLG
ncbi:AEC family transporter [Microbacterium halophytorum]|uniref:AEC family transporter n=1 Tax=Microbacterium halophytorum TaxID=2067568 RepID=UPI000CFDF558|nr:AEC family transporter [Microbacterium halophytorum]